MTDAPHLCRIKRWGAGAICHAGRMHRLIRRMLGMGPSPAEQHRAMLEALGKDTAAGFAEGLRDPRPLTADEMDHLMAYTGRVARRSFSELYDDED